MADTKLTGLTSAAAFSDSDLFYVVQGTTSFKTTWSAIKTAILAAKYPEVANYAALPSAAANTGVIYVCLAPQGTYFINRKPAGFYNSNGTTWTQVGDLPENYFVDNILQIQDDVDGTKVVKFQLSGLTTATTRTVSFPDADITVVGTAATQTLTNKTLTSPTLTTPALGTPASGTLTSCTGLPVSTGLTGAGTGVLTALGNNTNAAGGVVTTDGTATLTNKTLTSPTLTTPAIGTPASGTLTNCTGLPVSTGVSGLGTGVGTFLATPTSANLAAALTDETGSGANVFGTDPVLTVSTPASGGFGYLGVPQNSKSAAYTTVLSDAGKAIYHPASDANARTFTIDSNANVAYPVETTLTFINLSANAVTIAITSDTMYLAGAGTTGSRTLAQYGIATAYKFASTSWLINGTGLT